MSKDTDYTIRWMYHDLRNAQRAADQKAEHVARLQASLKDERASRARDADTVEELREQIADLQAALAAARTFAGTAAERTLEILLSLRGAVAGDARVLRVVQAAISETRAWQATPEV